MRPRPFYQEAALTELELATAAVLRGDWRRGAEIAERAALYLRGGGPVRRRGPAAPAEGARGSEGSRMRRAGPAARLEVGK